MPFIKRYSSVHSLFREGRRRRRQKALAEMRRRRIRMANSFDQEMTRKAKDKMDGIINTIRRERYGSYDSTCVLFLIEELGEQIFKKLFELEHKIDQMSR